MHIISGDLQLHKRTLEPIKTMIYGLRRYDVDRCAALINPAKLDEKVVVEGFMSHKGISVLRNKGLCKSVGSELEEGRF